jgi:hypothetical protein
LAGIAAQQAGLINLRIASPSVSMSAIYLGTIELDAQGP